MAGYARREGVRLERLPHRLGGAASDPAGEGAVGGDVSARHVEKRQIDSATKGRQVGAGQFGAEGFLPRLSEAGTDRFRIGIRPVLGEAAAFVGLDRVDAAEVVVSQVDAGAVRTAAQDEALAVRGEFRLVGDERFCAYPEERRDAGNLRVRDADDSVLDPTARAAALAGEVHGRCLQKYWAMSPKVLRLL